MTWNEIAVPVYRGGRMVHRRLRFAIGEPCVVELGADDHFYFRGEGSDLFEALISVRQQLEVGGELIGCNGARRDVHPSPMQLQWTRGRRAYLLTMPRTAGRPSTVDIFGPITDVGELTTVDGQRAWFDQWLKSGPSTG